MTLHVWKLPSGEIRFTVDETPLIQGEDVEHLGTADLPLTYEVDAQGKRK